MNRAMSRMINVFDGYLKENLSEVVMYIGFMFIFPVIFYLYNIRTDAVKYAFLLSFVWFLAWEAVRFARYKKRHEELLEAERKASAELYDLPETFSVIEKDYQRILKRVYHDKAELESKAGSFLYERDRRYSRGLPLNSCSRFPFRPRTRQCQRFFHRRLLYRPCAKRP